MGEGVKDKKNAFLFNWNITVVESCCKYQREMMCSILHGIKETQKQHFWEIVPLHTEQTALHSNICHSEYVLQTLSIWQNNIQ